MKTMCAIFPSMLMLAGLVGFSAAGAAAEPEGAKAAGASPAEAAGMRVQFELFVKDARVAADFYTRVLGFQCSGKPEQYIEARCGGVKIGICQDSSLPGTHYFSPEALRGRKEVGTEIVLMVDNLDAFHERVVRSGYPIYEKLVKRPWGDARFPDCGPGWILSADHGAAAGAALREYHHEGTKTRRVEDGRES